MRLVVILLFFLLTFEVMADSFVRFEEKGKVGLKNEMGKVLIPATFEALGWSDGNFSIIGQVTGYKLKGQWGLLNLQKELITPAEFESLTYPGGDRVVVSKKINSFTTKFGCIDLAGKPVIPFQYDGIIISGLRAIVFARNGPALDYGLIDLADKSYIPLRYRHIRPIGTLRYAVENTNHKTALFSEEGRQLTEFVIDSICSFRQGVAIIYQNFSQGIIDREGSIKVKPEYREIRISPKGVISARNFDEWRILDSENHESEKINADILVNSTDDYYPIQLAGKSGLLDKRFKTVLPLTYDYLGNSDHGKRVVGKSGHYGIVRQDTSLLLPLIFDSLILDNNFIRAVLVEMGRTSWALYDTFAVQKTTSPFDFIGAYNGKFFPAKRRGYWGAINRYGEEFIHCVFDSLIDFRRDRIAVKFRGQFGIIDNEEKWVLAPQRFPVSAIDETRYFEIRDTTTFVKDIDGKVIYFTTHTIVAEGDSLKELLPNGAAKYLNLEGLEIGRREQPVTLSGLQTVFKSSEGLRAIRKDGKYGFVDDRGRLRIANRYDDAGEFHEGLAPIKLIGKWGYVNTRDQIVINPNYESVEPFNNKVAVVWRNGKAGLIDKEARTALPFRYDAIQRLSDQTFLVRASNLFGLVDQKGDVIIEPRFDYLQNVGNGFVIAGRDGKFGLLTLHGYSMVPMIYDQLMFNAGTNKYLALKKSPWKELKVE